MERKKELYHKLDRILMEEEQPSAKLNELLMNETFSEYPFRMLAELNETEQSPKHHPEGNAWIHTLMVVDEAAKCKEQSSDAHAFMWAALLHDIGKPKTTRVKKDRITSYEHEKVGADLSKEFLIVFTTDRPFINKVTALVRWHMQILFVVNDLPFKEVEAMKLEAVEAGIGIKDVALLGWCDRMGRKNSSEEKEKEVIEEFYHKVNRQ